MKRLLTSVLFALIYCLSAVQLQAQQYKFYVAAESEDKVFRVSFDSETNTSTIENTILVGEFPTENEGPHGIGVAPSGDYWFVSLGHGVPYGHLYKYEIGTDRKVARTELGMFPATLDISPATGWVYIANFNLHGPHEPSTVSVVDGVTMDEIQRIETGVMPHGSRLNDEGTMQYHVSMMTDELYELDAISMDVSRVLNLSESGGGMSMGHSSDHGSHQPAVKPTWASPNSQRSEVYVAGNGNDKIYVVGLDSWTIKEVWDSGGKAPYNLEPTHDGNRLVVTYKGEGAVGVWDVESGEQLAKLTTSRKVTHGVVISPDDRYAFVTSEGIGGESGTVDILSLETLEIVDTIEVGKQAAGIAFWKVED